MTHPFGLLRQRNIILQYYVEHSMFIIGQIKCSWLLPHRQAICFSSLIWLSRNKSVKKSRFSRIVKNSREFSLLDLDLEAFWFHYSLNEKEWKHFFSFCTSRKRVKVFCFHFSLLELQIPTLAGPCRPTVFILVPHLTNQVQLWDEQACLTSDLLIQGFLLLNGLHVLSLWTKRTKHCRRLLPPVPRGPLRLTANPIPATDDRGGVPEVMPVRGRLLLLLFLA